MKNGSSAVNRARRGKAATTRSRRFESKTGPPSPWRTASGGDAESVAAPTGRTVPTAVSPTKANRMVRFGWWERCATARRVRRSANAVSTISPHPPGKRCSTSRSGVPSDPLTTRRTTVRVPAIESRPPRVITRRKTAVPGAGTAGAATGRPGTTDTSGGGPRHAVQSRRAREQAATSGLAACDRTILKSTGQASGGDERINRETGIQVHSVGRPRPLRPTPLLPGRGGEGWPLQRSSQLADEERLGVCQLGQSGPHVVRRLFERGKPGVQNRRVGQSGLQALELPAGPPPGNREADGSDGADLGGREKEAQGKTAQLGIHVGDRKSVV